MFFAFSYMQNKIYRTKDWNNDKESVILHFLYRSARAVRDRSFFVTVASLEWFIDSVPSISRYRAVVQEQSQPSARQGAGRALPSLLPR